MPTKREMLEEKTVEELKQMARDADMSGYSNARKSELMDMIDSEYTKDEIESWGVEKESGEIETEGSEIEGEIEEESIDIVEIEDVSAPVIDKHEEEEEPHTNIAIGIVSLLFIVFIIILLAYALIL